jgi:hypothetical protein
MAVLALATGLLGVVIATAPAHAASSGAGVASSVADPTPDFPNLTVT